jgi:hypothetical protein
LGFLESPGATLVGSSIHMPSSLLDKLEIKLEQVTAGLLVEPTFGIAYFHV